MPRLISFQVWVAKSKLTLIYFGYSPHIGRSSQCSANTCRTFRFSCCRLSEKTFLNMVTSLTLRWTATTSVSIIVMSLLKLTEKPFLDFFSYNPTPLSVLGPSVHHLQSAFIGEPSSHCQSCFSRIKTYYFLSTLHILAMTPLGISP